MLRTCATFTIVVTPFITTAIDDHQTAALIGAASYRINSDATAAGA
jgi:hypothetical protein